ncbi:regulator of G-protein signaling 19 [Gastrophryne carolinensis]
MAMSSTRISQGPRCAEDMAMLSTRIRQGPGCAKNINAPGCAEDMDMPIFSGFQMVPEKKPSKKLVSHGKMVPVQRARLLAYEQPSKSVAASLATTQNRLREHALRSQSETQKPIPDPDQERQAKVVGQLKAAEARDRVRLMRLRFQHVRYTGPDPESPMSRYERSQPIRSHPCCLCWCCCCSCSWNEERNRRRRLSRDTKLDIVPHCESCGKPSSDEVHSWSHSFEKLMRNPAGRNVFREFLRTEYSEENMLFWLACEELKKDHSKAGIEERARTIYEDYISILSPKEVSLDSRVREVINRRMQEPSPHTFDDAQLQIYTLMHRDSYPRFLNSAIYKSLLQNISRSSSES